MYFVALPDHHGGDYGGAWMHENFKTIFAKTAVLTNSEHVAVTNPVWDRPWFTNVEPRLVTTNAYGPSWWGVYGSDRLAHIVVDDYAIFGVPTQIIRRGFGGSAGEVAVRRAVLLSSQQGCLLPLRVRIRPTKSQRML